ncbi:MAG: hypothetical protein H6756_00400 [Candidatus Omnitrophica bacterium]|nr:hypothetical protein [Candidatus Omnitrophota bacterium]MCB9719314.1 hypothetical protein [Candidatus Omnitrophota bacterium]
MRVVILTTIANHAVYYATLADYFNANGGAVTFLGPAPMLTTIRGLTGGGGHAFVEADEGRRVPEIIRGHRDEIGTHDAAFFDEGFGRPEHYFRALQTVSARVLKIQTVHNVNTQLQPRYYLNWDNFRDNTFRKRSMGMMGALLVCSPVLKEYIRAQTNYGGAVFSIPFLRPQEAPDEEPVNGRVTFAVPGGIDTKRRHYNLVLDAFVDLWRDDVPANLKFIGQAGSEESDRRIVTRCRELGAQFTDGRLRYFERRLTDAEFDAEMRSTDVILANLEASYEMSGTRELYGRTKESGITYHMLNYAKPALVPRNLVLMPRLERQVATYTNVADFTAAARALTGGNGRLRERIACARENAQYYREYFDAEFAALAQWMTDGNGRA